MKKMKKEIKVFLFNNNWGAFNMSFNFFGEEVCHRIFVEEVIPKIENKEGIDIDDIIKYIEAAVGFGLGNLRCFKKDIVLKFQEELELGYEKSKPPPPRRGNKSFGIDYFGWIIRIIISVILER